MEHRMALAVSASAAMLLATSGIAVAVVGDVPILGFGSGEPPVTVTIDVPPVVVTEVITMDHVVVIPGVAPAIAIDASSAASPVVVPEPAVAAGVPPVADGSVGAASPASPAALPNAAPVAPPTQVLPVATVVGPPATVAAGPIPAPQPVAPAEVPDAAVDDAQDAAAPPMPADCVNPVFFDGYWECEG